MQRMVKWLAPVVALGLLVGVSASKALADDAKGSISGTVTGADGKPAAEVAVRVLKGHAKGEKPVKGEKPAAVAEGKTDADGKFEIKDIPVGDYIIAAGGKGVGAGREKASVVAGEKAEVSITLKAAPAAGEKSEGHKKHVESK